MKESFCYLVVMLGLVVLIASMFLDRSIEKKERDYWDQVVMDEIVELLDRGVS